MFLEIITPEKKIFQGRIKSVRLPGKKGSFEILKNHAPIISTLEKGTIRIIDENNQIQTFETTAGVVENKNNNVVVLLESV